MRCEACSILIGRGYLCTTGEAAPDGRGVLCCACARALRAAARRGRDPHLLLAQWRRALALQEDAIPRARVLEVFAAGRRAARRR